jgi:hypothetical protein
MIEMVRKIVPPLASRSDDEIAAMMNMMPPDYEWYLSETGLRKDVGVLVVNHGFGEKGDAIFAKSLEAVARAYPTAVAYGMAMMTSAHIQDSVEDLVAAGAETIVVVPATQSEFDTGIRQYRFIVGQREEPAYMRVPQVKTPARIVVTPPLADHPVSAEILLDHAREISRDEPREVVVIVGHGPVAREDNERELEMMGRIAARMQEASRFADVTAINLQDDAGPAVREANVERLRRIVTDAGAAGREVLVVGFLLGTAGIQPKIEKDLEGLAFRFNPRGLSEHPRFAAWVMDVVNRTLAQR